MTLRALTLLAVAAALAGCAAIQRENIGDREDMLSAAGFKVLPLTSPARQEMIAKLPPDKISQRIEGEHVSYLYPDPVVCHCLYVGGQGAYGRFQQARLQRRIADDQLQSAQMFQDQQWNWGPWGGYGPGFY